MTHLHKMHAWHIGHRAVWRAVFILPSLLAAGFLGMAEAVQPIDSLILEPPGRREDPLTAPRRGDPDPLLYQHAEAARQWAEAGDLEAAAREILQALEIAPEHPELLAQAANLCSALGRDDEAAHYAGQLAGQAPDSPAIQVRWGALLFKARQIEKAREVLTRAVERDPADTLARFHLGCVETARGDLEAAARWLDAPTTFQLGQMVTGLLEEPFYQNPRNAERFERIAGILIGEGDASAGEISPAKRVAQLSRLREQCRRAQAAMGREDWPGAIRELEAGRAGGAQAAALSRDIAFCFYRSGDPARALEWAGRTVEKFPLSGSTWGLYGLLLLEAGRFAESEAAFRAAGELNPAEPEFRFGLACALAGQEKDDEALSLLKQLAREHGLETRAWLKQNKPFVAVFGERAAYRDIPLF
jgi:tetratricopeptide (TPR) repeat protein